MPEDSSSSCRSRESLGAPTIDLFDARLDHAAPRLRDKHARRTVSQPRTSSCSDGSASNLLGDAVLDLDLFGVLGRVRSAIAMSLVMRSPADRDVTRYGGWRSGEDATSVVPAPMSTSATPRSFLVFVNTAWLDALGFSTS